MPSLPLSAPQPSFDVWSQVNSDRLNSSALHPGPAQGRTRVRAHLPGGQVTLTQQCAGSADQRRHGAAQATPSLVRSNDVRPRTLVTSGKIPVRTIMYFNRLTVSIIGIFCYTLPHRILQIEDEHVEGQFYHIYKNRLSSFLRRMSDHHLVHDSEVDVSLLVSTHCVHIQEALSASPLHYTFPAPERFRSPFPHERLSLGLLQYHNRGQARGLGYAALKPASITPTLTIGNMVGDGRVFAPRHCVQDGRFVIYLCE